MKARLLQFAMVLLIGITLAGCAGTGAQANFCEPAGSTHPARPLESCGY